MALAVSMLVGPLRIPETVLDSEWFAVLAAFVALNTVMYTALAVAKTLPKVYLSDWFTSPERRSENRSIYPEQGSRSKRTPARREE